MKINEVICKTESEIIEESFGSELSQLIQTGVVKPFTKFKHSTVADVAPKLKMWAIATLNVVMRYNTTDNATSVVTLKKIINDPVASAKQILDQVVSGSSPTVVAAKKQKEEDQKIDDFLSSITF